jgi:nondiscriminating glutamyl-tRNA synthetase
MQPFSHAIRVRFAPSPTGYLHVGGLRTALYNYLFAKRHGGTFILRVEDTDRNRFVEGAIESLAQVMETTGLVPDEGVFLMDGKLVQKGDKGPYIQSERLAIYQQYADELIANGKAYYCFCTAERLDQVRAEQTTNKQAPRYDKHCLMLPADEVKRRIEAGEPHVVRLNVSLERGDIIFDDLIRGQVKINAKDIDDQVLMKSDGFPTYHLANVVDDHLMEISHVIRAEEWLSPTPKHVLLYEAFGWEMPQFAHLPLLLNLDKSKLSKRQGDVAAEDYLKKGYLKEALINFVALLGWNPGKGSTEEIFSLDELTEAFDLAQVHKAGAVFDLRKLDWMNAEYIKRLSIDELYEKALPSLESRIENQKLRIGNSDGKEVFLKKVLTIEQDRLAKLSDVGVNNPFFFSEPSYEAALLHWKDNTDVDTKDALSKAHDILENLNDIEWEKRDVLEKIFLEAAAGHAQSLGGTESGRGRGDFLWPLRVALTGAERSPSPSDCAWVLGKDMSLIRIRQAIEKL